MAHELTFHRGSSTAAALYFAKAWHREGVVDETIQAMSAKDFISRARGIGARPARIRFEPLRTESGIVVPDKRALITSYDGGHPDICSGVVGNSYEFASPEADLLDVEAFVANGARPAGAFMLRDGAVSVATFDISNGDDATMTHLLLLDSYNGSTPRKLGFSVVRPECANMLRLALNRDGKGFVSLRHSATIEQRMAIAREAVTTAIAEGQAVAETLRKADRISLNERYRRAVIGALAPNAERDRNGKASPRAVTRAANAQAELDAAATLDCNVGSGGPNTLAALWNGATYRTDRTLDGSARPTRGDADPLASMLLGSRGADIAHAAEIVERIVQVYDREGRLTDCTMLEALDLDIPPSEIGVLDWVADNHPIAAETNAPAFTLYDLI